MSAAESGKRGLRFGALPPEGGVWGNYPFRGDIRVRPDAFLSALNRFERNTLSDL